jgi:flagellar motility protein MotE (MotC chaperone)
MIDYFRDLRLLPIAVVASACLLALLAADLLLGRAAAPDNDPPRLDEVRVIHARPGTARPVDNNRSWAGQMFNYPDPKAPSRGRDDMSFLPVIPPMPDNGGTSSASSPEITGTVPESAGEKGDKTKGEGAAANKQAADNKQTNGKQPTDKQPADKQTADKQPAGKEPKDPPPSPNGTPVPVNATPNPAPSAAERAILERLQERRQELEKRARELDIREGLLADAEKRVESKLMQIKEGQQQLATAAQQKDEAEAARFKSLVTMYESMKPRDAAKIFDRLDVNVLLQVASMMNPRAMSEILALMTPDRAQQLTVELASRAKMSPKDPGANLPKIEGRPTGQ